MKKNSLLIIFNICFGLTMLSQSKFNLSIGLGNNFNHNNYTLISDNNFKVLNKNQISFGLKTVLEYRFNNKFSSQIKVVQRNNKVILIQKSFDEYLPLGNTITYSFKNSVTDFIANIAMCVIDKKSFNTYIYCGGGLSYSRLTEVSYAKNTQINNNPKYTGVSVSSFTLPDFSDGSFEYHKYVFPTYNIGIGSKYYLNPKSYIKINLDFTLPFNNNFEDILYTSNLLINDGTYRTFNASILSKISTCSIDILYERNIFNRKKKKDNFIKLL